MLFSSQEIIDQCPVIAELKLNDCARVVGRPLPPLPELVNTSRRKKHTSADLDTVTGASAANYVIPMVKPSVCVGFFNSAGVKRWQPTGASLTSLSVANRPGMRRLGTAIGLSDTLMSLLTLLPKARYVDLQLPVDICLFYFRIGSISHEKSSVFTHCPNLQCNICTGIY